ncbi:hypothetical protein QE370_000209 [Aeromicrobium sp. SORGH_AS981]|uniref:DUF5709 domain-containing protein n=1 Tax=Aeromicrobium sp. SORGH_AS_0981 TaxID=3041802 RepID=UPI00285775C3|nr:DUF5709 domain-containing protein [Aeromicrobium sp. SORGH_AS_0981]MDR6117025.1 hypothetical protein [Aeromicrobium sp. SORGH_AS_0981]
MTDGPLEFDDTQENRDDSEVLDQLQPDDTLVDRGVDDVLDEGYSPAEKWSPGEGFGTTADEALEGETLDQRVAQEEPDVDPYADVDPEGNANELGDPEIGDDRSGRLVAPDEGLAEDTEKALVGDEVGIDGAAASAEEAAVHVVEDDPDDISAGTPDL